MAWTTPATYVSGAVATAAGMNTYVKDNLAYLKSLLDGTGGAVGVTVPNQLAIFNDAAYFLSKVGAVPYIQFDTGDNFQFDRTSNLYNFVIGSAIKLALDVNGKLTGAGFYDSGEFTVAGSGMGSVSHGLAAAPRFVFGYWASGSGVVATGSNIMGRDSSSQIAYTTVSSTTISYINNNGSTRYGRIMAML